MPTPRTRGLATLGVACLALCLAHKHHGHKKDGTLHEHHEVIEVTSDTWEKVIQGDPHIWVVKFHSPMCGSCQAFAPTFEEAREKVDGLHWASVSIDNKDNIPLAKKFNVLEEGIPNVKLINAGEAPLAVVSGDTPSADTLAAKLLETLKAAGAKQDAAGYYKSLARGEL